MKSTSYQPPSETNSNITWIQFNNLVPLIASAVMIATTFLSLKGDVRVLTERIDTMITQQSRILAKYEDLERRYGALAIQINTVETKIRK